MQLLRSLAIFLTMVLPLGSAASALTLLRDPDIEHGLKTLAAPILSAAGLSPARIDILVIDDTNMNAFVVDADSIFIHSGLILRMDTPQMLQAVIAHEAAHIANGHLLRRPINARNARTAAGIGTALAAAAGAVSGSSEFAIGAAAGLQGAARGSFFAHTRAEESAADESGMRVLARAGIDLNGALAVLDIFRGQESLSVVRQDTYLRTHPLSQDRYRRAQQLAAAQKTTPAPDPKAQYWFARLKGKLSAFQRSPKWTLTRANDSGFEDVRLMREAIAWHRQANLKRAISAMDGAQARRADDPYLFELRGQILLEGRQIKPAVSAYARAASLAPENPLILGSYGRALLADDQVDKALEFLEKSRARDGRDSRVLRDLAVAHSKQGNNGMAAVVTAERYAMGGRMKDAAIHAQRASDLLPRGSPAWQRAQDVLSVAKASQSRRKQ